MSSASARMRMKGIVLVCGALLVPSFAAADIYKWVDAHGQVHFSDAAPKNTKATTVLKQAPEALPGAGPASLPTEAASVPAESAIRSADATMTTHALLERQQRFAHQLQQERMQREAKIAKEKQQQEKYNKACERAKNRLDHFKSVNRFYHENHDGTVRYLSDEEGDQFRREAQTAYNQHCDEHVNVASQDN